jgi:hypothetical protein
VILSLGPTLTFRSRLRYFVMSTEVETSLIVLTPTVRVPSHSTGFARSGQAFNMAALPLLTGCNSECFREQAVTLPLGMTKEKSATYEYKYSS